MVSYLLMQISLALFSTTDTITVPLASSSSNAASSAVVDDDATGFFARRLTAVVCPAPPGRNADDASCRTLGVPAADPRLRARGEVPENIPRSAISCNLLWEWFRQAQLSRHITRSWKTQNAGGMIRPTLFRCGRPFLTSRDFFCGSQSGIRRLQHTLHNQRITTNK